MAKRKTYNIKLSKKEMIEVNKKRSIGATKANLKSWKNPLVRKRRIEGLRYVKLGNRTEKQVLNEIKQYANKNLKLRLKDLIIFLNLSDPTIRKLLKKIPTIQNIINKNNELLKKNNPAFFNSRYKNGQCALYMKIRKEIRAGEHICNNCKTKEHLEIHHKDKLHYDEKYRYWRADNFNNEKDNIIILCNSCHQKLHYRELGRKSKVKHSKDNGRFLKNGSNN